MTQGEHTVVQAIVSAYTRIGVPTDRLPYTPEFEALHDSVESSTGAALDRGECWRLLTLARKRGLLPRLCR